MRAPSWVGAAILVASGAGACAPPKVEPEARSEPSLRELAFSPPRGGGLSGLASDGEGTLWAVAERDLVLLPLRVNEAKDPSRTLTVDLLPIVDVPTELAMGRDLESLAWLDGDRFAAGTEAKHATATELVLYFHRDGATLTLDRLLELPRALWPGLGSTDNAGIEGLCATDGILVAALEATIVEGDARFAPIASVPIDGSVAWRGSRLLLSTDEGKISSLSCTSRGSRLEVFAIERHFRIGRVLRFELDPSAAPTDIVPEVVADLASHLDPIPNFESIEYTGNGFVLLTDNDYRGRPGPSRLFALRP